ncbi:MAG: 23S rRNA (guanosine(2251)-2'-O)-methyltransferase RlmB [Synergistaceae bacterium]|nr:23S rRNA (guanosine(2251)-2'-O)-methyltransferase RlmB [Synergistaceae bacterium]
MNRRDDGSTREIDKDYCWGRNQVLSLLEDDPSRCLKVFIAQNAQSSFSGKVMGLCRASKVPYSLVDSRALDSMLEGENHQGVAMSVSPVPMLDIQDAIALLPPPPEPAMAVLLDHVQDPRNVGAVVRSAEAAGAAFVALPTRRGALPTGTVAKTSAGASLRLPIASVGNVAIAARNIQEAGLWAVGLDESADGSIYDSPLPARCLLVVGNEGDGLTKTTRGACDEIMRIPMEGKTGSLNASVAVSICMFEWLRVNRKNVKPTE